MPIDPYDPWDDPITLPPPGAYDYRRDGSAYAYTSEQANSVGATASVYPWMSPGVAASSLNANLSPEVVDADYVQAQATTPPPSKRRLREQRRNLRRATFEIKDTIRILNLYGNDEWSPATPGEVQLMKQLGVYGGEKKTDRQNALTYAANLSTYVQNADDRTRLRLGRQLQAISDGSRKRDGDGSLGEFLMAPVQGALDTVSVALGGAKAANDALVPQAIREQDPLIPGTNAAVRNAAIAVQFPLDLFNASVRDFAYDISQSPETLGVLAENNKDSSASENFNNLLQQTYAYQAWAKGKPTGDGLLPSYDPKIGGKESAAAAAGRQARELYPEIVIGDHAWTPGRALADLVSDPDEMTFSILSGLVDGVIAVKFDPVNAGLASIAAARATPIITATEEGAAAMRAAGGIGGFRNRVNVTTARSWLLNEGMPIVKALRANAEDVLLGRVRWDEAVDLARQAFPEIPLGVHRRLANIAVAHADATGQLAPDSAYLDELYRVVGTEIRGPLNTNRVVGGRFLLGSKSKMWATLPPNFIDLNDPDEALRGIEAAGRHINASPETIRNLRLQIIRSAGTPAQNEAIARATMSMFEESFVNAGMSREWAQQATRLVQDRIADARTYDVDEDGLAAHFPTVQIDGRGVPIPDPALITEMRNTAFELPDARMSKRIVSGLGQFLDYNPLELAGTGLDANTKAFNAMASSIDAMDSAMGVWKQLVLMRPAWGLRVIAEEQLRMAANGNVSFFRSPLSAIAWILGNPTDSNVANRVRNVSTAVGAVAGGVYGAKQDGLEGAVLGAVAGGAGGYALGRSRVGTRLAEAVGEAKTTLGRGGSGIRVAENATAAPSLFDPSEFDEYQQALYGGFRNLEPSRAAKLRTHLYGTVYNVDARAPQAYAEELVRVASDPVVRAILNEPDLARVQESFWSGELSRIREFLAQAPDRPNAVRQWSEMGADRQLADDYINYVAGRIERVTNGNADFLEVMRTGMWDGEPVAFRYRTGGVSANPDVYNDPTWTDAVRSQAPNRIRAEHQLTRTDAERKVSLRRARGVVDSLFDALMPRPSNYLSRSPMFRQSYWQRIEELFPEMGAAARTRVLEDARQANLGRDTLARFAEMNRVVGPASRDSVLTARAADTLAKRFALDETRNLLYDLSEKSEFFDATRLIFPFGEAWKEIVTRWAKLLAEHPNYIRRAQQTIQAARQMKVDEVTGLPDPGGIGMFHKDIVTGEESFIYPMTGLISDKLMGVPIPLVGSVQGLNLIGTGLPGIGPIVQFPIAAILPDTPKYDTIRSVLFPFGEPEGDGPWDTIGGTLLPAWIKKLDQAFSSPNVERLQGNVVAAMMQYKLSTGEYDVNGANAQDEINRLLKDSKGAATQFMVIRGLAQAMSPSAPQPQFLVKHGPNLVIAAKIAQDYRKRAEKVGWDNAFEWLLETYGSDTALLLAQPRSEAKIPGLTSKTEQLAWERNNTDLATRYPDVWTMFAPRSGEFDIGAYTAEFERGQRDKLTPEQIIKQANNRLARHIYNRQRDALESDGAISERDATQLKTYRDGLVSDFPGYDPYTFQNRTPTLVLQLRDAVKDPSLSRTAAGRAMSQYLGVRDQAEKEAKRLKVSLFGTSARGKRIRDRLFLYGEQLRREIPDFGTAWDEVFVYEFKDR